MKRILLLVALSVILFTGTVSAALAETRGARFYRTDRTNSKPANEQIADAIEVRNATDSTGMSLISSVKCRTPGDRSCASAHDLLVRILANDPDAKVNGVPLTGVSQLPEFYRTEVTLVTPLEGTYYMDCEVVSKTSPSGWAPFANCVQRPYHFKDGERAFVDRTTGRVIGAEDCANPVGGLVGPKPCAYIEYDSDAEDADVRIAQYGTVDIVNDECTALLRAGEKELESPFVEQCPDIQCNFRDIDAALNQTRQETGSHQFTAGKNVLSVPMVCAEDPAACRIVFCKDLKDGRRSLGLGVQTVDFFRKKDKRLVATILHDPPSEKEPKVLDNAGAPSVLYWHFGQ